MKAILCAVVVLLLAACGEAGEPVAGGPASTSQVPEQTSSAPFAEADLTRAPPIVLESAAGRQTAVRGSACVRSVDPASGQGVGLCTDMEEPTPVQLNTVRPGEKIRIVVEDADVDGSATVRRLGCESSRVAEIPLGPGAATSWTVELEPGAYELDVFVTFDAEDGRTGDAAGSLGLRVDETAPLALVPATGGGC